MRIRASLAGDIVEVKILMRHDMETGLRKDAAGVLVPALYIKNLVAKHKDKVVFDANFGPSVSKDPFLSFKFKGGAVGDKVAVTWIDTAADTRTDEGTVT
jgi:sulfur-oxidizing protein SoxZ